jgi:hypothetical protein
MFMTFHQSECIMNTNTNANTLQQLHTNSPLKLTRSPENLKTSDFSGYQRMIITNLDNCDEAYRFQTATITHRRSDSSVLQRK